MVVPVGGARARVIRDSLYWMLYASLADLGWFDLTVSNGGTREHRPVALAPKPLKFDEPILVNTLGLTDSAVDDTEGELGSNLTDDNLQFYVDLFAEDDSVGAHLIGDVRDILRGKMPSIGRFGPILDVYDFTIATPVVLFRCEIVNVHVSRVHNFPHPWQRHWRLCRFELEDHYTDESG